MNKLHPNSFPNVLAFAIAVSTFTLLTITGCSSGSAPEPDKDTPSEEMEAKEIKAKSKTSLDLPELELFSNARRQYQSGLYSVARESFSAMKDNYPTGPYAEFSELKVADTHFENGDYARAGQAYEDFTKNRPASSALAYAFLRAGRSFELSSAGVGRDPTPFHKALEIYTTLIERFPNSVYTPAGKYYKRGVDELLATYEKQVIAFYDENSKSKASEMRDREFQKRFGSNSSDFESGGYNKKASLAVGPVSEEKILAARRALQSLPPVKVNNSVQNLAEEQPLADGKFQISSVSCDQTERLVVLLLNPKPSNPILNLAAIKKGDSVELRISDLTTVGEETKTYSCFAEGDMTISSNGLITIKVAVDGANALYIDNPARVILTLN